MLNSGRSVVAQLADRCAWGGWLQVTAPKLLDVLSEEPEQLEQLKAVFLSFVTFGSRQQQQEEMVSEQERWCGKKERGRQRAAGQEGCGMHGHAAPCAPPWVSALVRSEPELLTS